MRSHLRYSKITRIFITHMHGDHIFGLPGLICAPVRSRAEQRRVHGKKPTRAHHGPAGIRDFVRAAVELLGTAIGLPLVLTELTAPGDGARDQGPATPRPANGEVGPPRVGRAV